MIVFENDCEIDPRSISTFGVSAKAGTNPIGFFGTGLKYAIAVLLREKQDITIYSGLRRIEFSVKREELRGNEFCFVMMAVDDAPAQEIGFTTELGKGWDLWMAYRELACNCIDEGGEASYSFDAPEAKEGKTIIVVEGQEFESIFGCRGQYILEDEPYNSDCFMELRNYPNQYFFYRGVRVSHFDRPSLYTYNCKTQIVLTEDRTVKDYWRVGYEIVGFILRSTDHAFIRTVVTAKDSHMEGLLDFHGWSYKPSDEFIEVVGKLVSEKLTNVNPSAVKVWEDATASKISPKEIELTKIQQMSMERALDFCEKIGFSIRGTYPIKVVESLGSDTLGLAKDETIYIAERVFQIGGTKQLASTLIEEYVHLRHGWHDLTRELQNFLFEKMVSLGEEIVGEPL